MSSSIQDNLRNDSKQLEAALNLDPNSARIEAQSLLQAVLQVNRAYLLSHPEQPLNEEQFARYRSLLDRRLSGEPVAYILGEREFYGLNFKVTPATLIPRPETELLIELALQRIPAPSPGLSATLSRSRERGWVRGDKFRVLDLGTGSGAIALSIAHARPDTEVVAVDASTAALEVAQFNAQNLCLKNVRFLRSDWFSALRGERFDLIVSNPPYIADSDAHLMQGDLRFEPRAALASGTDGLDGIRRICTQAKAHLNPGGWLLLEHGYDQAERVRALFQQAGFDGVFSARDIAGIERVSCGKVV
ncbi:MAG: protein-(glutamine-N5) methyltransferase, release factor-specific [Betaproteobacteria bacterium RBG_16_56_24]|nr:MAG: protein-(glutamine-N5) methyltransferase, release factor-specific [Betaproteobacteria bacterium RBG_16_56_24]